jgi:hypothetical protein
MILLIPPNTLGAEPLSRCNSLAGHVRHCLARPTTPELKPISTNKLGSKAATELSERLFATRLMPHGKQILQLLIGESVSHAALA